MTILALAVLILAVSAHAWSVAALAALPLVGRVWWRAAVVRSGFGMRRGGRRRIVSLGAKW